jgi:hypothetical protein
VNLRDLWRMYFPPSPFKVTGITADRRSDELIRAESHLDQEREKALQTLKQLPDAPRIDMGKIK